MYGYNAVKVIRRKTI